MNICKKIDHYIKKLLEALMILSVFVMSVVLIANVFYRFFFQKSIVSAEEIGRYCIFILTFLGLGYVAQCDKHVKISAFFELVSWRWKRILIILINCISALIMIWVSSKAFEYVSITMATGRLSATLSIPVYYVSIVVFAGFLLLAIEYIIEAIMNMFGKDVIYMGRLPLYKADYESRSKIGKRKEV